MRRTARALGATILLAALLIGIPVGLATTIGNPLDSWPAIKAGDASARVVIDLLAAVVWLCWAQFAAATLLEAWAAARHVSLPTHVPFIFGGGRQLARSLIVAAFMLGPALGSLTPPLGHAGPPPHPPATTAQIAVAEGPNPPTRSAAAPAAPATATAATPIGDGWVFTVQVDGLRTLWDLADSYLGDGQRWHEIWTLNRGRQQPDGVIMTNPALLRPGWTVVMPAHTRSAAAPSGEVLVQPGDTLSEIAAEHGLDSWQPMWQTNAGRAEPTGDRFTDPNLIRPGWLLRPPTTTAAPPHPPRPTTRATPHHRAAPHRTPQPDHHAAPQRGHPAPDLPPATTTPPATPPTADPDASRHPAPAPRDQSSSTLLPELAMFGGGGALLAGMSWLAVTGYRRRQFRFRRPGRAIPATPHDLVDLEKQLRAASLTGLPDVTWLNQAMRSLVHTMALSQDRRLPDLLAVRMTDRVLELILAAPHTRPPEPWQTTPDGTRWTVHRHDQLPFDPHDVPFHFAPYPTLATVGHTADGNVWLIDLERIGALTLTGAMDRCLDLARALAAELAHNVWSEQLQVSMVGFGQHMAELNPARLSYSSDLDTLLDTVPARLTEARAAGDELGVGALDSRLRSTAGDVWAPHVVLIAPPGVADRTRLDQLLVTLRGQQQRSAFGIVLADDTGTADGGAWTVHVAADGSMHLPALGVTVHARQVSEQEAAALTQLMVHCAATLDRPMPVARGPYPSDSYTDVAGALLPQVTIARDATLPLTAAGPGTLPPLQPVATGASHSVLPQPDAVYVQRAAVVAEDLDALAPGVGAEVRHRVEADTSSLDQDLADWYRDDADRPKLQLLGPVGLALPNRDRSTKPPRMAMSVEVITYLATRRHGATVAQIAAALWPRDPDILDKTLPKQKISLARRLLGRNPRTGRDHIPHSAGGVYVVEDVLIDAELCRRLHTRGSVAGADGIPDLWKALDLVRGVPLDQRREGGYEWLVDTPLDTEYLAMIVDISTKVVTHELARGDPAAALRAAQIPVKAGSNDDIVLLNLMKAHDAAGERALGDACVQQILASFDVEDEVDLPPRTAEILRRRRYE